MSGPGPESGVKDSNTGVKASLSGPLLAKVAFNPPLGREVGEVAESGVREQKRHPEDYSRTLGPGRPKMAILVKSDEEGPEKRHKSGQKRHLLASREEVA